MRFVVLGLLVIAGLNPATAQEGRTFVERLELDTPEEAVQSFIDAFAAKDFLAAYFMLTPPARNQFTNTYYSFNVASYFNTEGTGWIAGSVYDASEHVLDDLLADVGYDPSLIFDNVLLAATANGQVPFSVDGATIGARSEGEAGVTVTADTNNGPLSFETLQVYTGDWRIDRITWPGSDAEARPWGIRAGKTKP